LTLDAQMRRKADSFGVNIVVRGIRLNSPEYKMRHMWFSAAAMFFAAYTALMMAPATAADYPAKPIRIIVSLAPGGGVDTTARLVSQKFTETWGQQIVIENRPGAGGTIATEMVARSAPDGYTLLMTSVAHSITPSLYKLSFDAVKDFSPVTLVVLAPSVLVVHPSLPVKSVKELLAFTKARPNQVLFSSAGNGSPQHLAAELLKLMTGVSFVHVPYKGTAPSITDLIGGRVSVSAASVISTMPHVNAGRLRGLAVISGKRSQGAPQLPTVAEAGVPGYEVDTWYGMFAPAGTSAEIVAALNQETIRALAVPEAREKMLAIGLEPVGDSPEHFAAYVRSEVEKWAKVIKAGNIRID
jgi:tripartite-type tricarboxylate transporter receptor subunit TctC